MKIFYAFYTFFHLKLIFMTSNFIFLTSLKAHLFDVPFDMPKNFIQNTLNKAFLAIMNVYYIFLI